MNLTDNYYKILGIGKDSDEKTIKKAYYKLSFSLHPDKNPDVDPTIFHTIIEAYTILSDKEQREEYDLKSKFGNNYNEYFELFDVNFNHSYEDSSEKLDKFKTDEVLNIHIGIDDSFNGVVEYERWVRCKSCDGTGKDLSSKIIIKDNNGNILRTFDADDGCDFCDGTGKDYANRQCSFCFGKGKIGMTPCTTCKGERRILGKQKLSKIKLTGDETKIESMGNCSKTEAGKVGYLLLIKTKSDLLDP
jgi:DnaJ-class molecular chaperone